MSQHDHTCTSLTLRSTGASKMGDNGVSLLIFFYIASLVIGIIILHAVIKSAIKMAVRELIYGLGVDTEPEFAAARSNLYGLVARIRGGSQDGGGAEQKPAPNS
ncbi:hypothetical protein [Actinoplanes sp. NPDC049681]|uniref:hypothetical protein n=1 Tax=Actinoplanes sp. NPDC049681 TaxID=3363905 RepID=UPI003792B870